MEVLPKPEKAAHRPGSVPGANGAKYSAQLLEKARADADTVLKELESRLGRSGRTRLPERSVNRH
jgi:hypothetical protein